MKLLKRLMVILTILCLCSTTINAQQTNGLDKLKNYVLAKDQLHTCGSIKTSDLKMIQKQGVKTIIGLNTESPSKVILLTDQAAHLEIQYIHIPVSWEKPSIESLDRFFKAMEAHGEQEILVHCRLNWRASAFVYLYRTLQLKEDPELAKESLLAVWKPERKPTWKAFMEEAAKYFQTN